MFLLLSLGFIRGFSYQDKPRQAIASEDIVLPALIDYGQISPNFNELERWEIKKLIYEYSVEFGVDFNLAYNLAVFESNLNPKAKNPKSSAVGIYQFLTYNHNSTWMKICVNEFGFNDVYDAKQNIECAIKLIAREGINHWTADFNVRKFLLSKGFVYCMDLEKNICYTY